MAKELSEECCALAFYGLCAFPSALGEVYQELVRWSQAVGWPPDRMAITGESFSGKLANFARVKARLQKAGFDKVRALEFYSLPPGGQIAHSDWALTAGLSREHDYCLVAARSSVASLTTTSLLPLARSILEKLKPSYGIGYRRPRSSGADLYAIGIPKVSGFSEAAMKEREWVNSWNDGNRLQVYRDGVLRDVYEWNFLTRPHLSRRIAGLPLDEWVRQDGRRGQLIDLGNQTFLWVLVDAALNEVRSKVWEAGLVFERKNYVQQLEEEYQQQKESEEKSRVHLSKQDREKRDALIAKVLDQYHTMTGVVSGSALVSLEDFFEGNKDRDSIAVNLLDEHPGVGVFYKVLRGIRSMPSVQEVLIAVCETPDPDESADNDVWPESRFVLVVTSASRAEIESWVEPLKVSQVQPWRTKEGDSAFALSNLPSGMSVWRLVWD